MDNLINAYKLSIKNNFAFLKSTETLDDLHAKTIKLPDNKGYLVPITQLHQADDLLIQKLADWRNENAASFPSQAPVTFASTKNWLVNFLLKVEDRLLFLVADKFGNYVGHLGFANGLNDEGQLEVDNVVRGVKNANPGIMHVAMQQLLQWANEVLMPKHIYLRVLNDNAHAIQFYKKLGFSEGSLIPVPNAADSNGHPIEKNYLRMEYTPTEKHDHNELILTAGPSITAREVSYTLDAVRSGWNNQWNKYIKKFEHAFCDYLETNHALSTASCTGALHIALAALGIGPGDEVIVPDITWVATANAVVYVGATPVFADVDINSWCMDPVSFESLITERTKAVIPVHLYGHPAPMHKIVEIARKHNLYIIEDAAPAIGAQCNNQKVGTFGDFAAFSFQGAKLAVTGEGGMLITNNKDLFEKAYSIWDQGREPNTFWIKQNGLKYKMSNVQAAIGLGQIERVDELIAAKRRIFAWYEAGLKDIPSLKLNYEMPWARSIYWMSSIMVDGASGLSADTLRAKLKAKNVDTRPVFPSISQYPHWPKRQNAQPNAHLIGTSAINLPSGVCLQKKQVDYVCDAIKSTLDEK